MKFHLYSLIFLASIHFCDEIFKQNFKLCVFRFMIAQNRVRNKTYHHMTLMWRHDEKLLISLLFPVSYLIFCCTKLQNIQNVCRRKKHESKKKSRSLSKLNFSLFSRSFCFFKKWKPRGWPLVKSSRLRHLRRAVIGWTFFVVFVVFLSF